MDDISPEICRHCLWSSYEICCREALLPKSLQVPLCYDPTETPQCVGVLADVWKGEHNGQVVAAKALRIHIKTKDGLEQTRRVGDPQPVTFS